MTSVFHCFPWVSIEQIIGKITMIPLCISLCGQQADHWCLVLRIPLCISLCGQQADHWCLVLRIPLCISLCGQQADHWCLVLRIPLCISLYGQQADHWCLVLRIPLCISLSMVNKLIIDVWSFVFASSTQHLRGKLSISEVRKMNIVRGANHTLAMSVSSQLLLLLLLRQDPLIWVFVSWNERIHKTFFIRDSNRERRRTNADLENKIRERRLPNVSPLGLHQWNKIKRALLILFHWWSPCGETFEFLVIFDFFALWYRRGREASSVKIL